MDNLKRTSFWLALTRVKGLDRTFALEYLKKNGAEKLFEDARSLPEPCRRPLAEFDGWRWVEREMELAEKDGARIVSYEDDAYPPLLREIHDPPYVLYSKGGIPSPLFENAIAVVGTRRPSHYGEHMAEAVARDLARMGVTVVSGMARGCDTRAHRGCLSAGGATVAVLGTGIDIAYPRENRNLYGEIQEKGVLLTELPMGTPPVPFNFPKRNRVISGISKGVLVVEAPVRSGALMTAKLSLEQGREVFAVPGPADSPRSRGTNMLIKEGALLVEDARDIASALSIMPRTPPVVEDKAVLDAGSGETLILSALGNSPLHIDAIVEKTGLTAGRAASILTEMELAGTVVQKPGKFFLRRF